MNAKVLRPNTDHAEEVTLPGNPADDAASFDMIRDLIGGYVEVLHVGPFDMYVDEDGQAKKLPLNIAASLAAGCEIVGTAVTVLAR